MTRSLIFLVIFIVGVTVGGLVSSHSFEKGFETCQGQF